MDRADAWFICRTGYVETVRAVALSADEAAVRDVREEWPMFGVVEVDQRLVKDASTLATAQHLGSLDALHLAGALLLPREDLLLTTWDRRLHAAALGAGLHVMPTELD